ncbi:hypothetical protein I317_07362 [Kwoniella heveanensis CBS 569]|nr:hypothetical protein I317_07362 [Kwoniella heveanensis CBS 569]
MSQSRPRRSAAVKASSSRLTEVQDILSTNTPGVADPEADADPEFLSLSVKQRKAIDRAFARGLKTTLGGGGGRRAGSRGVKRRRVEENSDPDQGALEGVAVGLGGFGGGFVEAAADGAGGFLDQEPEGADGGGGFMLDDNEEGGGFVLNDDGDAGGFLPDDAGGFLQDEAPEAGAGANQGGFIDSPGPSSSSIYRPQSATSTPAPPAIPSSTAKIPLYILPGLLTSLGLPSDEDVLGVFRASASGWEDDDQDAAAQAQAARRRKKVNDEGKEEDAGGVLLKDFRAVCAALMPSPSSTSAGQDDVDISQDEGDLESDDFEMSEEDDESELSSLSGSEYGGGSGNKKTSVSRTRKKSGTRSTRVKATDFAQASGDDDNVDDSSRRKSNRRGKKRGLVQDSDGKVKLSSRQKELAKDIWEMLKPPLSGQAGTGHGIAHGPGGQQERGRGREAEIMSRDEVHKWVRTLGEMWDQNEVSIRVDMPNSSCAIGPDQTLLIA